MMAMISLMIIQTQTWRRKSIDQISVGEEEEVEAEEAEVEVEEVEEEDMDMETEMETKTMIGGKRISGMITTMKEEEDIEEEVEAGEVEEEVDLSTTIARIIMNNKIMIRAGITRRLTETRKENSMIIITTRKTSIEINGELKKKKSHTMTHRG